MDEMRELITVEQAERFFIALAILAPLVGACLGILSQVKSRRSRQGFKTGLAIGMLGPLNFILWKVYNSITDRLGLDTVKNLLVNLVLFAGLGLAAGLTYNRVNRPRPTVDSKDKESE